GLGLDGVNRLLGLFGDQPGPQLTVLVGHASLHPEGVVKLADLRPVAAHAAPPARCGALSTAGRGSVVRSQTISNSSSLIFRASSGRPRRHRSARTSRSETS